MSDLQAAQETASPDDAAIDVALARSVLYHAVTLGLRPQLGATAFAPFDTAQPGTLRAAASLLDALAPPGEALLAAIDTFCTLASSPADRETAHARIFGHSRGLVCPFETEYGAEGAFRQPQELADIAGTYLAFGLRPPEGGDERVDHAACECEFMDFLARKEAFLLGSLHTSGEREGARESVATVQAAARGFLREHLGRFGRAFASLLIKEDAGGFHGALGALFSCFLTQECLRFGLPPGPAFLELRPPMADDTPMACGRPDDELIQIGAPATAVSTPTPSAEFRIAYDAVLVEESVLLAERRLSLAEAADFRAERDRLYAVGDPDEREARFEELHGRFFLQLGLDRPLHEVLAERPELMLRTCGCRILPAVSHQEEMADVRATVGVPEEGPPTIVVRLRPQSMLDAEALGTLLRRELLHVADMLDPSFGYLRELPSVETDPAMVNLFRERYRVLWDTSIDGRLRREGLLAARARAARLFEFARAFPTLRDDVETAFAPWFDRPRPTHAAMVAFIQEPRGPGTADERRCPLCRLPSPTLERGPDGLDREVLSAIERDHPGWRPEHGRCARCAEVYLALVPTREPSGLLVVPRPGHGARFQ